MAYPLARGTNRIIQQTACENFGLLFSRLQKIQNDKINLQDLVNQTPLLNIDDFRDLRGFVQKLTDENNPVSLYIFNKLGQCTQDLLREFLSTQRRNRDLETLLVEDCNKLLEDSSFYQKVGFENIILRAQTQDYLLEDKLVIYRNRLLLEVTYPLDIKKLQIAKFQNSKRIFSLRESQNFITALHQRLDGLLINAKKNKASNLNFSLTVDWRLVVGLGNPSVFDTGLRLHSIYGFPYLPGQGLKGAIRRVWMLEASQKLGIPILAVIDIEKRHKNKKENKTPWEKFENLLIIGINPSSKKYKIEKNQLQKEFSNLQKDSFVGSKAKIRKLSYEEFWKKYISVYQTIFGGANGQGQVNFLDVYPTQLIVDNESILEVDIINAHYGDYYTNKGKIPPADYLSPNPIFFLCVRKNTPFQIRVIINKEAKAIKAKIEKLIKDTATDYGLGAKTMSGYGEMY